MALTIQFESHRVELPLVYEMEHDPKRTGILRPPPSFRSPIMLQTENGCRSCTHRTISSFANSAGWVECKTSEDIQKLATSSPNRYSRDNSGTWRCPPGEAYASALGLGYRVWSSGEINWILQRNLQFLEDYLRCDPSGAAAFVDLSSRLWSEETRVFFCAICWKGRVVFQNLTRSTC